MIPVRPQLRHGTACRGEIGTGGGGGNLPWPPGGEGASRSGAACGGARNGHGGGGEVDGSKSPL